MAIDPSCIDCLSNAAETLKRKGRMREAWEAASLALALLPEEDRGASDLAKQVARYRRDLASGQTP